MNTCIKTLSRLPLPVLYGIGSLLRFVAFSVVRYRRRVIEKNLNIMFPEATDSERRRIRKDFERYFVESAVETIKGLTMSPQQIEDRVVVENPGLLQPYIEKQQSMLILTLHQTNIEWLVARICRALPCPMAGVYKPLHSPTADSLIKEGRARFGTAVPMKGMAREILRQRKGFRGILLVADQSPISREKRFWYEFFGRRAPFYMGPQAIAEAGQSLVVFVHPRRVRRGHYSLRWEILAEPPHAEGGTQILERFIEACERSIREQPETWWLSNKKWKSPKPWEPEALRSTNDKGENTAVPTA